jgi:orotidine-5'-phosphate decarboxylase
VQHLPTPGGTVARSVAELVTRWGADFRGTSGFSAVGAVVAPAEVAEAKALRDKMPDAVFLVPGFGAQGRSVDQVKACFRADGSGALVNSSRGVLFAHADAKYRAAHGEDWRACTRAACADFVRELESISRK